MSIGAAYPSVGHPRCVHADWIVVYDLREDGEHVRHMQEASLDDGPHGLAVDPLVGSPEWWHQIADGSRPTTTYEGVVARAYWASMADWPEFSVRTDDGSEQSFTREGDGRRLAEGLRVRVDVVHHPWKTQEQVDMLGGESRLVVGIWVEDSPERGSNVAPGPGGVGYDMARERGSEVHYLVVPTEAAAKRCVEQVGSAGHTYRVAAPERWYVECWTADGKRDSSRVAELSRLARACGGHYDGGEEVDGDVWGPVES